MLQESIRRIIKEETETKFLIYIYFCDYMDPRFDEYVNRFNNLNIDFWVKPGKGHHNGFTIQSILNTNNLNQAKQITNQIYETFDEDILIVISKQSVSNTEPIGTNNEKVFTKPGRYFDKLIRKNKKGIYLI